MICLIVFSLCVSLILTQTITPATPCVDQLHNLFLSYGLSNQIGSRAVIAYSSGTTASNVPYVTILVQAEDAASYYWKKMANDTSSGPTLIGHDVSYFSFDVPLCATDITLRCTNDSAMALNKTGCANIPDQDIGFPSLIAGRLYVYADHLYPCNGMINITMYNVVILDAQFTTRYIYDISGITSNRTLPLSPTNARNQYIESGCDYNDGSEINFAINQRQFACVDRTIGCVSTNNVTAVAPPDFAVTLATCDATTPSVCIPLNGSASSQTGSGPLYYQWTAISGWPLTPAVYDNVTCHDYISGLFNATSAEACVMFSYSGLYRIDLTVYDNGTAFSTDTVYINVVIEGAPLVLPNESIGTYPPIPLRTFPPINRPIIQFPTHPPESETPAPSATPRPFVNTTVASLLNQYPPLSGAEIFSLYAIILASLFIFVIFIGLYIALMPSNETNYMDRIRYFNQ